MLSHTNKVFYIVRSTVKNLFFFIFDYFILFSIYKNKNKNRDGVLIVRLDAIGDFILWLDTAKEYSRIFPGKNITLLANSAWANLAKDIPYWDSVWSIEMTRFSRSPLYRLKLLCKIRRAGFEIAIQPTFSRVFLHGDSIIRASGAKNRIGSLGDMSNITSTLKAISNRWYTNLIPAIKRPLMELDRNAEFLRNLTNQEFIANLPKLPILTALPDHLKLQGNYFIIFPGASWHGRQ